MNYSINLSSKDDERIHVISGFEFCKLYEAYKLVDVDGNKIHLVEAYENWDEAKKEFFLNQKVKVYLRKYKLKELMYKN